MYNELLKSFIDVADSGSFSKAAEKLYISATAVMKQMNMLETQLGLSLFSRTNHGIKLTAEGESIYKEAKYIIDYSDKAVAKARLLSCEKNCTICIGTSLLNPCKIFMDLWYNISDKYPNYKLHVVPFEDNRNSILSEIEALGIKYDFLVGACDSKSWLTRCNFLPLGEYKVCVSVPYEHPLASKKLLDITDLYGNTIVMVERGDSVSNDLLRDELESKHPGIHIESTSQFYDIEVFNNCVKSGKVLMSLECWKDIHPSLVTIPVNWDYSVPYGIMYSIEAPNDILSFLEEIKHKV